MSGSWNRHKVNCRASQLPVAPHSVSRRHLRKATWLTQDRRQPGVESAKVYKTHCQGRSKRKTTLVLTFPFCTPVNPRGSWAVDVLSSALPEPLVRRALEPGPAPSQDAARGSGKWAQIVHSPFLWPHTHFRMEKPRFGEKVDILNVSLLKALRHDAQCRADSLKQRQKLQELETLSLKKQHVTSDSTGSESPRSWGLPTVTSELYTLFFPFS